ncbi:MAG: protein kinase [Treponema sp.]|nr:protein kinase [Treponema sp.]
MPGKVIVKVAKGEDKGKSFEFSGQRSFVIGREKGCAIQLSERTVSRCHCGMEINPPKITFYDAGSKNGTYINGELVCEGRGDMSPEEAAKREHKTLSLRNGDTLGIGVDVELSFTVIEPEYCAGCLGEIEEGGNHVNKAGERICAACFEAQKKIDEFATIENKPRKKEAAQKQAGPVCTICGAPLGEIKPGQARICDKCKKPDDILDRIIEREEQRSAKETPAAVDIQNYRQIKKLGEGGMGVVYLVEEADTGKKAALKYMQPSESVDEHARMLFLRETEIGKRLDHPHVIKQYDSGSIGDSFYILMEYCRGGSVDGVMEKVGPLPEAMAVDITLQVLDGLAYTHSLGIIHRDIKPFNFFIANDFKPESFYKPDPGSGKKVFNAGAYLGGGSSRPVVKVADFGLAKAFDSAVLTKTGEAKGTLSFAPRQQIMDSKHVANEVDTWAVAASLYFMLTGRTPKPVRNRLTMFDDLLNPAVPIRKVNSFISQKLATVIDKALVDSPTILIQEAADLHAALQAVL